MPGLETVSVAGGQASETQAASFGEQIEREEHRIRAVYEKRWRTIPSGLYSAFNHAHSHTLQQLERRLLRMIDRGGFAPLGDKTICEIGCGGGHWLRRFIDWGADPERIAGFDLLEELVAHARKSCPAKVRIECANAASLPLSDDSCDIIAQFTVFSSILDAATRRAVAAEMLRILRPGGIIIWYDTRVNNPWNHDVRGLGRREVEALFPGCSVRLSSITLAPPINRVINRVSWLLSCYLEMIPFVRSHYLGMVSKS